VATYLDTALPVSEISPDQINPKIKVKVIAQSRLRLCYWALVIGLTLFSQWVFILIMLSEWTTYRRRVTYFTFDQHSIDTEYAAVLGAVLFCYDTNRKPYWLFKDQISVKQWRHLCRMIIAKPERVRLAEKLDLNPDSRH
jgi:hypothetical protein